MLSSVFTFLRSVAASLNRPFRSAGVMLFCLGLTQAVVAQAHSHNAVSSQTCTATNLAFDPATDPLAFEQYATAISGMLKAEKFSELECLANALRTNRERFSGGSSKLHKFYQGLDKPMPGHPTEEDWQTLFNHLNRWVAASPKSVSARIALAKAYTGYAWNARGDGYSDTVSDSGWKLMAQRLAKAREIMDQAAGMSEKCPEFYVAMMDIARGEDWDAERTQKLLDQAIAFDSTYEYLYMVHAEYILPKWGGEAGDAARFAQMVADRVGGDAGDMLYFKIGLQIVCACRDPEFLNMSWPRAQKGFAAIQAKYGDSLYNWNVVALMAMQARDYVAADKAFQHVGGNWDKSVWITANWFQQQKEIASQFAPLQLREKSIQDEVLANMRTHEGELYFKDFAPRFNAIVKSCAQQAEKNGGPFRFMVKVGKNGVPTDIYFAQPTLVVGCIANTLGTAHAKSQVLFPIPPRDDYWVSTDVDPSMANTATK
jgi:hypothetical protein